MKYLRTFTGKIQISSKTPKFVGRISKMCRLFVSYDEIVGDHTVYITIKQVKIFCFNVCQMLPRIKCIKYLVFNIMAIIVVHMSIICVIYSDVLFDNTKNILTGIEVHAK